MAEALKRINILVNPGLLEEVRRLAKRRGKSVSEFIRETLRKVMEEEKFGDKSKLDRVERLRQKRAAMPRYSSSSEIIREWREKGW